MFSLIKKKKRRVLLVLGNHVEIRPLASSSNLNVHRAPLIFSFSVVPPRNQSPRRHSREQTTLELQHAWTNTTERTGRHGRDPQDEERIARTRTGAWPSLALTQRDRQTIQRKAQSHWECRVQNGSGRIIHSAPSISGQAQRKPRSGLANPVVD